MNQVIDFLAQTTQVAATQPSTEVPPFLLTLGGIQVATDYGVSVLKVYLPKKIPVAWLAIAISVALTALSVYAFHAIQGDPNQLMLAAAVAAYSGYRAHTDEGPVGSLTQNVGSSVANDDAITTAKQSSITLTPTKIS